MVIKLERYKPQRLDKGVSVITCTNNFKFINNLLNNYKNQNWGNKELIIIINRDDINLLPYRNKSKYLKNVSIYRLPEKTSLGKCLNFAVARTRYQYVAKFDHDDYYAPNYLKRSVGTLKRKEVDVVWKSSVYVYLNSRKSLLLRYPNKRDRLVGFVAGGTIMFKKKGIQAREICKCIIRGRCTFFKKMQSQRV